MTINHAKEVASLLTRMLSRPRSAEYERTDGELLCAFIESRDARAFQELVRRHGPMVFGVCTRVLRHHQDAEDAFQATFLVLSCKADSVSPREAVGNWLYGVALQTAIRARSLAMKRREREVVVSQVHEPASPEEGWDDLAEVLDEELGRLPDHYRAVIVLCDVEGRTRADAARHLGCPEGSVSSRLSRARAMLARRLSNRGITLSSAALAVLVGENAASGTVPAALVKSTLAAVGSIAAGSLVGSGVPSAVATLTKGVLNAMLIKKIKVVTLAALILGMVVLGGAAGYSGSGAQTPAKAKTGRTGNDTPLNCEPAQLVGSWTCIKCADVRLPLSWRAEFRKDGKYLQDGKEHDVIKTYSLAKNQLTFHDGDGAAKSVTIKKLTDDVLIYDDGVKTYEFERIPLFDAKLLIGSWAFSKVEGMAQPPDGRMEFVADGRWRQSMRRDGKVHLVEGTHALEEDQLWLKTVEGERTKVTKIVTITKLTKTSMIFTDNGKSIELAKDRFLFHPGSVPATDLKIGITSGKTVAVAAGPEQQKLGLKLEVTIKNDSKAAIKTLLPHEWHGGEWPSTALYAAVAPVGAKQLAAYHPVYRLGESSAKSRNVTIEAGGTHEIEIRTNWPGTGSVPAIPLIDKPGKYSAKFALVFEADGKQQVVESNVVTLEYAVQGEKKKQGDEKKPLTAKELTGKWFGEAENKDGIKKVAATMDFDVKVGGDVRWLLRYETEESSAAEIGIVGKRVEDVGTGRVNLRFENGKVVLGHLTRGENGTLVLTMLPEIEKRNKKGERVYRQFKGLVLRREELRQQGQ